MTLKTASVLAFERKLDPSDALFHAGNWDQRDTTDGWRAVAISEKSVRGTISNRLKAKDQDPAKLDAAIENPNLQKVDVAALPSTTDTLKVVFTLRVLGGTGKPSACNDADYLNKLLDTVRGYANAQGFGELARRYAFNLANGRFLWRNRIGSEQVEVRVAHLVGGMPQQTWTFDALALPLRSFDAPACRIEISGVNLYSDELASHLNGCNSRRPAAHVGVADGLRIWCKTQSPFNQCHRLLCWVFPVLPAPCLGL